MEFILTLVNIIIGQHFPFAIIATFLANNLWYNRHWIIIKYVPFDNWKLPIIKKDRYLAKSQVSLSKNRHFFDNFGEFCENFQSFANPNGPNRWSGPELSRV